MFYFCLGLISLISNYIMNLYERIIGSVNIFIFVIIILFFGIYSLIIANSKMKENNKKDSNIYASELIKLNEKEEIDEDLLSREGNKFAKEMLEKTKLVNKLGESTNEKCKIAYKNILLEASNIFESLKINVKNNEKMKKEKIKKMNKMKKMIKKKKKAIK